MATFEERVHQHVTVFWCTISLAQPTGNFMGSLDEVMVVGFFLCIYTTTWYYQLINNSNLSPINGTE